jgi:flavin-dependent dehydrogenase
VIDVAIAGGGVAGSSLAILLGRAGFTVQLFERDCFPREKPCGEGIMPGGVAALARLGLAEAVGGAVFRGVRYFSGDVMAEGRFPVIREAPSTGVGQRRRHLDQVLFEAAAATAGVTVMPGVAVTAPLLERGRVCGLVTAQGALRARCVVAADGLLSPLRRLLGLDGPPTRRSRAGFRAHYRLADDRSVGEWVEVHLGNGYELYVTPLPNAELLVAALAERATIQDGIDASFRRWFAEQPQLAARLQGSEQLGPYLGRSPLARTARAGLCSGAVLLGDAAGYIDPITGGGITQALMSAELLARAMPGILGGDAESLTRFDRERRALLRDYALLTRALLAISGRRRLATAAVRLMQASPPLFSHLLAVSAGMRPMLPAAGGRWAHRTRKAGPAEGEVEA